MAPRALTFMASARCAGGNQCARAAVPPLPWQLPPLCTYRLVLAFVLLAMLFELLAVRRECSRQALQLRDELAHIEALPGQKEPCTGHDSQQCEELYGQFDGHRLEAV